ncbi:MAG: hypothetical protein AB1452_06485 [Pseudomonadota bacterium]
MADIPHAALSDALKERIDDRTVVSAVFLTYKFDPAFFEQQVLPILFNLPLNHATEIRRVQLEDRLRDLAGEIAVYYDAHGLIAAAKDSAKLDVRRIPVRHRTGIFHPKNIFLLLETPPVEEGQPPERALLAACLSANLTRAGWWENVEVCHFEEIHEADKTLLKPDLADLLGALKRRAIAGGTVQRAVDDMLDFLRSNTEERQRRTSDDYLHTRFYGGAVPVHEFLDSSTGGRLRGAYLDVISPYLDDADDCKPLEQLVERFAPKEVHVLLPKDAQGQVMCRDSQYEAVRSIPGISWARLPTQVTKLSSREGSPQRFVHAKVYRFFHRSPAKEYLFVGSANLTTAAHDSRNLESGFLVEREISERPESWLITDVRKPAQFQPRTERDEQEGVSSIPLVLRYDWSRHLAEAMWLDASPSPTMHLDARGIPLGQVPSLAAREWKVLANALAENLRAALEETSFVRVLLPDSEPAYVLVQEEGMAHKPSLLLKLSIADILRYWTLLSQEQRAAFIAAKWPKNQPIGEGAELVARVMHESPKDTMFDRFAGFFHAFGSLERSAKQALAQNRPKEAASRLFGKKYDSLPVLLEQLATQSAEGDTVERYVLVQCALQLVTHLSAQHPAFWKDLATAATDLEQRILKLSEGLRAALIAESGAEMTEYLKWFDRWFIRKASPIEVPND